ncbi:hypothetical protein [Geodermatophilus marinus]|uniref:hypothetical protein n=1 Tax=Geodermatophilus sp. LHW52908 TaxID=2303986 RepID=UPI000E3D10DF|nr:hypothetical protein [Geodermatophilus sp. LHW52908]RFU22387.1 hypothetical protein D0Z06_07070 [Geodermatophilus sp. LHW52908]
MSTTSTPAGPPDAPQRVLDRADRFTQSLVAWVGIATAVGSVVATASGAPEAVRLVTVLAFVCAGPGAAVMSHVATTRQSTSWAMTTVVSLALWGLGSAVLGWSGVWSPTTLLVVLAAATVASCAGALLRERRSGR